MGGWVRTEERRLGAGHLQGWSVSDRDSSGYHCLMSGCYYGANSVRNSPQKSPSDNSHVSANASI